MSVVATPKKGTNEPRVAITQAQKQALADNLQLEVTERARKLRNHYVLMAENLRYRLEMRVNRIPNALRNVNLQELIERAGEQKATAAAQLKKPKLLKRPSEVLTDKENGGPTRALANPKKRQKQLPTPTQDTTTSPVRKAVPVTVLSPKSLNSRIIPPTQAGSLHTSPSKMNLPRPVSPVKSAAMTAATSNGYKALSKSAKHRGPNVVESANGDIYTIQIDQPAPPTSKAKTSTTTKTGARSKASTTAKSSGPTAKAVKKGGLKSALASLTSGGKRAAGTRNADPEQSDAASVVSVSASNSSGRVLRRRGAA